MRHITIHAEDEVKRSRQRTGCSVSPIPVPIPVPHISENAAEAKTVEIKHLTEHLHAA